jgi:hypothetical protein
LDALESGAEIPEEFLRCGAGEGWRRWLEQLYEK